MQNKIVISYETLDVFFKNSGNNDSAQSRNRIQKNVKKSDDRQLDEKVV